MFTYKKLICLTGAPKSATTEEACWTYAGKLGVKAIVLREPTLSEIDYEDSARRFLATLHPYPHTLPILHRHLSVARSLGHPYLHLPLPVLRQHKNAKDELLLLGTSCHNEEELAEALALGAHYVFLSPLFPTASKPGAKGMGLNRLEALIKGYPLPVYALGGIDRTNAEAVMKTGVTGVAMLSGWQSQDGK